MDKSKFEKLYEIAMDMVTKPNLGLNEKVMFMNLAMEAAREITVVENTEMINKKSKRK